MSIIRTSLVNNLVALYHYDKQINDKALCKDRVKHDIEMLRAKDAELASISDIMRGSSGEKT